MRRLANAGLIILLFGGLTGCQPVWIRDGEGPREFAAAANECLAITRRAVFPRGLSGDMIRQEYLDHCITEHGYRQVDPRNLSEAQRRHGVVAPLGAYLDPNGPD